MNYQLVETLDSGLLEDEVIKCIQDGWEPIGGISVVYCPDRQNQWHYAQAMIHRTQPFGAAP